MLTPIEAECLKQIPDLRHGFFTRQGGVSEGIYASLNCGHGSKDERAPVQTNRTRVATHLGTTADRLLTAHQVHSAEAIAVTGPWSDGSPKVDGIVTAVPGLAVAALAADCAPVLFADPKARIVAAAHAGWKGALGGVLEATVAMMERMGAQRQNIRAALGPCIGPTAYEVGPEFEATFLNGDPNSRPFFRRSEPQARPYFDLPGYVMHRLERAGLAATENATRCTYSNEDLFFSFRRATHRKETDYGRQISAIVLQ
jgi:hypothetical protein